MWHAHPVRDLTGGGARDTFASATVWTTTRQRWQETDRIFAAALEREPAERASFLDEACAGDEELRKEVESLLTHDTGESIAGGLAVEETTRMLAKGSKRALPGDRVGPYLITGSGRGRR